MSAKWDGTLRYLVDSRSTSGVKHVVELGNYDGSGACSCLHFSTRLEPLLKRGVTPATAAREKLVKLKANRFESQILMCDHIVMAREQFCTDAIRIMVETEKRNETKRISSAQH